MKNVQDGIHDLYQVWQSLQALQKKDEDRLWEKFRLEWNYNSNHIEGNTLTYGDTELLLRMGDDFKAHNNSLRDVEEMRAHDVAIFMLREWAQTPDRSLLESDIRDLNKTILVRPFWADARTSDGQATRRLITPGQYKEFPNHVQLKSGEIFRYAEPNEVAPKMQELLDWYNTQEEEHPVVTAAFLHYKFVCIHPFDDGNGRVSRLLMNYHLMKAGYPPIIIKSADKNNYLYALNQADTGNVQAFVDYIAQQLIWSLELAIKAAKGESIEERDDLYKEIEVWKKGMTDETNALIRSDKLIEEIYDKTFMNLLIRLYQSTQTFEPLFIDYKINVFYTNLNNEVYSLSRKLMNGFKKKTTDTIRKFSLELSLANPINESYKNKSSIALSLFFEFELNEYNISVENGNLYSFKYPQQPSDKESEIIVNEFTRIIFNKVKQIIK